MPAVNTLSNLAIKAALKAGEGPRWMARPRTVITPHAGEFARVGDELHAVDAGEEALVLGHESDDLADVPVPAPDRTQILQRLPVIESMAANDNRDAALVLAWAALEATARVIAQESAAPPPRSPKEALQLLEHLDRYALQTQRPITIPLIRAMLQNE